MSGTGAVRCYSSSSSSTTPSFITSVDGAYGGRGNVPAVIIPPQQSQSQSQQSSQCCVSRLSRSLSSSSALTMRSSSTQVSGQTSSEDTDTAGTAVIDRVTAVTGTAEIDTAATGVTGIVVVDTFKEEVKEAKLKIERNCLGLLAPPPLSLPFLVQNAVTSWTAAATIKIRHMVVSSSSTSVAKQENKMKLRKTSS